MATARDYFRRCVALARENGLGRIEVSNRSMIGFTRYYLNELREAVEDGLAAVEAAAIVGHQRAEMLARFLVYMALFDMGEIDQADPHSGADRISPEAWGRAVRRAKSLDLAKLAAAHASG